MVKLKNAKVEVVKRRGQNNFTAGGRVSSSTSFFGMNYAQTLRKRCSFGSRTFPKKQILFSQKRPVFDFSPKKKLENDSSQWFLFAL